MSTMALAQWRGSPTTMRPMPESSSVRRRPRPASAWSGAHTRTASHSKSGFSEVAPLGSPSGWRYSGTRSTMPSSSIVRSTDAGAMRTTGSMSATSARSARRLGAMSRASIPSCTPILSVWAPCRLPRVTCRFERSTRSTISVA